MSISIGYRKTKRYESQHRRIPIFSCHFRYSIGQSHNLPLLPPNVICLVSVRASILMLWIRPSESVLLAKPLPLGPNRRNYSSLYGLQISPWYGFWKLRLMSSGVNIAMTIASDCFSIQVNQPVQDPNTVSWVLIVADLWSIWPQIAASHVFISYIKMALLA